MMERRDGQINQVKVAVEAKKNVGRAARGKEWKAMEEEETGRVGLSEGWGTRD